MDLMLGHVRKSCLIFLMTLLVAIWTPQKIYAWDVTGHRVVGEIAEKYLNQAVKDEILVLLDGKSMAEQSTWADDIKSDKKWTHSYSWHFVNIPSHQTYEKSKKSSKGDILEAIVRFQKILADRNLPKNQRAEALKFLIHFLGDLHQPLHVGYETDKGGNEVKVKWFRKSSNLHKVWDQLLIDHQKLSYTEWVRFIDRPKKDELHQWSNGTIIDWAEESRELLKQVYQIGDGNLGYEYSYRNIDIVKKRLLQGGIRLANVLNETLSQEKNDKNNKQKDEKIEKKGNAGSTENTKRKTKN